MPLQLIIFAKTNGCGLEQALLQRLPRMICLRALLMSRPLCDHPFILRLELPDARSLYYAVRHTAMAGIAHKGGILLERSLSSP